MQLQFKNINRLLLVLILILALLPDLTAAATAEQTATEAPGLQTAAPVDPAVQKNSPPCAAGRTPLVTAPGDAEPEATGPSPDEATGIQAMKQRYGQDPTGVRARLGMCRGGKGRQGGGPHRRFRGQNRWDAPQ